jgi:hypothetical protein
VECEVSPRSGEKVPVRAREILEYFVRHPRAADSIEGVARWRLLEGTVRRSLDDTERAVAWLVGQGFLVEESVTGSDAIFCLNHEKAAAAQRVLSRERKRHRRVGSK